MIWNPDFETLARGAMSCLQGERLGRLVDVLYRRVPFYRRKMDEAGVKPQDIQDISDICRLPFTTKDEMREVYPYGLLAVSLQEIVEIHTSSGTTGTPVVDAYTAGDIEVWAEVMARTLAAGGTGPARHRAERLRLRPVHRRPGRALRRAARSAPRSSPSRAATRSGSSRSCGTSSPPCSPARRRTPCTSPRRPGRKGMDPAKVGPEGGLLRRRAVERKHAGRDPGEARPARHRHLRADGDHRPGCRHGVRAPGRPARQRGSLLPRDHRPRHREGAPGRREGRAGDHHPHQGGHAGPPLPHPGHHLPRPRTLRLREDHGADAPGAGPHGRHAHHPRRERVPFPDRGGYTQGGGDRAALPARRRERATSWTSWRSRWK